MRHAGGVLAIVALIVACGCARESETTAAEVAPPPAPFTQSVVGVWARSREADLGLTELWLFHDDGSFLHRERRAAECEGRTFFTAGVYEQAGDHLTLRPTIEARGAPSEDGCAPSVERLAPSERRTTLRACDDAATDCATLDGAWFRVSHAPGAFDPRAERRHAFARDLARRLGSTMVEAAASATGDDPCAHAYLGILAANAAVDAHFDDLGQLPPGFRRPALRVADEAAFLEACRSLPATLQACAAIDVAATRADVCRAAEAAAPRDARGALERMRAR